ncbi:MAG TPA: 4-hydroxy-tetrahydrodipicolinate synthase [Methyloradius sp.]
MNMTTEMLGGKRTTNSPDNPQVVSPQTRKDVIKGIWVPLITPFKKQKVDLPALQNLAVDMIRSGVHGLVVCGTTGEAMSLSEKEQLDVLIAVQEVTGANYPIVMGVNAHNTTSAIEKVTLLNHFDLAGFLISVPYYVKPSQKGILMHFQQIANASGHPIILYNNPGRTGVNMEVTTVTALAKDSRFVGIKESSPDAAQLLGIAQRTKLKLFAGDDSLLLQTMNAGGIGAISAAAHIRPDLYVKIYNLVAAGKHAEACLLFNVLLPLIQLLFLEPNPAPVKALLAHQGRIGEELRLPMTPVTEGHKRKLIKALQRVNDLA